MTGEGFWWRNEPAAWSADGRSVTVTPDAGSDFWLRTHYGFTHDNGHLYGKAIDGDLVVEAAIDATFGAKYDQAGVMLWLDDETWIKAGVESVDGAHFASAVLTRGASDWSVSRVDGYAGSFRISIARRVDAVEVLFALGEAEMAPLRLGYFPEGPCFAGAMACAPIAGGFTARFRYLTVRSLEPDEPFGH
jgi:regulation of enolase protein 1 (concanavalin A-like superfamily)